MAEQKALKYFMKKHFDFSSLKKAGVYSKEMKHTDYEGQAKRICEMFGFASIYEYGNKEIRCHVSYAGERPLNVNENGELKTDPFVTTVFPNSLHL